MLLAAALVQSDHSERSVRPVRAQAGVAHKKQGVRSSDSKDVELKSPGWRSESGFSGALTEDVMFSSVGKRCFTIESLVAKDNPLAAEEPLRPTALPYHSNPGPDTLMSAYQPPPPSRPLYQSPDLVFPESVGHPSLTVAPHQLSSSHLQHPHFFGSQHRDPLHFYPWVLRNRFFGHRFQGECQVSYQGHYKHMSLL